ncbi:AMP-binding protein [Nocardia sp. 2]|uniref:AMP-binding protein n=1 Tax=Nocardia acididurans TaxID=2802282 RepID=A0ABS1M6R2_9NOCA|nr:AMP-binding protein [Nocardia acididurans]MBL1076332.1 AMP-binding protein [Nocardia acididurans]
MTTAASTVPLRPLLLPEDAEQAVVLLRQEIERMHRGGAAIAPVTNLEQVRALPETVPESVAVVLSTSGSSGVPKRTMLSRNALAASARASSARLGGAGEWLLCLPAGFIAGFQVVSRAVLGGTRVQALGGGAFHAAGFAAAARRLGAGTRYTSLVPTQVKRLLADAEGRAALALFDKVLIGGAPLDAQSDRRLREITGAVVTYGMTETCGGCVYDGRPLDGVQVRLVDGVIHLGGDVVADGYLGAALADSACFYTDGDRRWYRTADRGHWSDGLLVPTGRVDDLINTGGMKVSALAIEAAVAEFDGVDTAVILGLPDPEWAAAVGAYIVVRQGFPPPDPEALRAHVRERLGRAAAPKRIVFGETLPLLPNSKIDRRAVREFLSGGSSHQQ